MVLVGFLCLAITGGYLFRNVSGMYVNCMSIVFLDDIVYSIVYVCFIWDLSVLRFKSWLFHR